MPPTKNANRPYNRPEFLDAFWLMVSELGDSYFETELFQKPYRAMLSARGKKFGTRRYTHSTPEERKKFAYSGVYFNIKDTKGEEAARAKIYEKFPKEKAKKLIELWDSEFRTKARRSAFDKMKNT